MTVQELLNSPDKWTKQDFARDKSGMPVSEHSDQAVSWCLRGAIYHCYGSPSIHTELRKYFRIDQSQQIEILVEDYLHNKLGRVMRDVGGWNNLPSTKFEDIRELVETLNI